MYDESLANRNRGKNAPSSVSHSLLLTRSNSERVRLWHLHQVLGQHGSPVALSLQSIQLGRWKEKTLCHQIDDHFLSPELRFYYLALDDLIKQIEEWKLAFVTVNFSDTVTQDLAQEAKRTPAGAYADIVNKRLRKAGIRCQWLTVLEDHDENLHSHSLVGYHKDDEQAIRSCFRQDTDNLTSGMRFQKLYKLRSRKNTKQTVKNQGFMHRDGLGDFRMSSINIGASDYISKTLEKESLHMDSGRCRIYVPNQIRTSAKNRYEAARIKQQRLAAGSPVVSNLSCHQAMTFLNRGWIPKIDEDNDQRYEEQAAEIEEWMDRNDFRDDSSAYDWQYEEGDAELDAYLEVERWMAEEPSEHDYNLNVREAEAAWERELKSQTLSDHEYEQTVSEAILQARNERKANQFTEREYDRLMSEVDAFLDHQRWTECEPDEVDPDVPDDEIEAFGRQEGLPELVELITEHRDTLAAERSYTLSLGASRATNEAVMTLVLTAASSVRTADTLDEALGDSDGHAPSPLTLNSTLQNARRRPCERFGRRGITRHYSDVRTPQRRSLTRYRACLGQTSTPLDRRCLGPPQGTARWGSDEQGYGDIERGIRDSSHRNTWSFWAGRQETSVLKFAGSQRGSPRSENNNRVNNMCLGPQGVARHTIPSQE